MTTPSQTDPTEAMRDEAQRVLGQSIDCYVMDPDTMDYDPDHEAGVHIAFLAERGFEIRRRDAAAGMVCVSREDIRRILGPIKHRANGFASIGQTDEMHALDAIHERLRAALGETECTSG